jgi:hypothetical protein
MAMIRFNAAVAILALSSISCIQAYQYAAKSTTDRREWILNGSASVAALAVAATRPQAAHASKYCASGIGDGCDDLSEGNALIKSLQEKSAANKEKYAKVLATQFSLTVNWHCRLGSTEISYGLTRLLDLFRKRSMHTT